MKCQHSSRMMGFLIGGKTYVHINDFVDHFDPDSGGCIAHLGSQPKLGLWAERCAGPGSTGRSGAAVDGPNLAPVPYPSVSY